MSRSNSQTQERCSQLAQYQREEITQVAQVVQDNLRTLLVEATQ